MQNTDTKGRELKPNKFTELSLKLKDEYLVQL